MRFDADRARAEPVWEHAGLSELPFLPPVVAGGGEGLGTSCLVAGAGGEVYVVCGDSRLRAAGESGAVLAEGKAPASPSAASVLAGSQLLVPEGFELAGYDAATLALRWRRAAPEGMWTGPLVDGLCACEERVWPREPEKSGLWELGDDGFLPVAGSWPIRSRPCVVGSRIVLSCGGGAGDRLICVDARTGEVLWRADTAPPDPDRFKSPAPAAFPADPAVVAHGDGVIAVTQVPSVEARVATSGELAWRVSLVDLLGGEFAVDSNQPTGLAVIDGTVWVGIDRAAVVAIDAETGAVLGSVELLDDPSGGVGPHCFAKMPGASGAQAVVAIRSLGTIYGIEL